MRHAYRDLFHEPNFDFKKDDYNVVLDFLPIGFLPGWVRNVDFYWYDAIDNFTKHNRYTDREKNLVEEKYKFVSANADLITGVSEGIRNQFPRGYVVIPNALLEDYSCVEHRPAFDFGFIGFITDKFDVGAVKKLAESGYKVAVYGEFYDGVVESALLRVEGVYLFGKFRGADVPGILSSFKVGLIPYLVDRMHDESPLKLYQYLSSGLPVMSSFDFGVESENVYLYAFENIMEVAAQALDRYPLGSARAGQYYVENNWEARVVPILDLIGII